MSTKTPALGCIRGEHIEAYHATDAVSKSKLGDFRKSPLLYFRKYVEQSIPRDPMSDAFLTGQGAHVLTLEGWDEYRRQFVIAPNDAPKYPTSAQRNAKKPSEETIAAIAYWDEFEKNTKGKHRITPADERLHKRIRDSIFSHPIAALLISEGEAEVTFRAQGERYFIQARTDWVNFGCSADLASRLNALFQASGSTVRIQAGEPYCVDLKTTASLSDNDFNNFARNFVQFGYHRQGPMYRGVIKSAIDLDIEKFFFVSVETDVLFETAVFLPDEPANAQGWAEVSDDLARLSRCYDRHEFPGTPQGLQTISIPTWYLRKEGAL